MGTRQTEGKRAAILCVSPPPLSNQFEIGGLAGCGGAEPSADQHEIMWQST